MIDLSHPLDLSTPVYPNYPPVEIGILDSTASPSLDGKKHVNSSVIRVGMHCGTHLDAPFHFIGTGATIDRVALEACFGPAVLVRIASEVVEPEHLSPFEARIRTARRVVLHTGWDRRWGASNYFSEHPVLTGKAAEMLVEWGVVLVGVDMPSVDRPPHEAHLALLGNGVLILENLTNLAVIRGEIFTLAAFPLKITGRDGSPVRAVAWETPIGEAR